MYCVGEVGKLSCSLVRGDNLPYRRAGEGGQGHMGSVSLKTMAGRSARSKGFWREFSLRMWRYRYLYLMLLPALVYFAVFRFYPMLGNVIAFKDYNFRDGIWGSPWIGFEHFRKLFNTPMFTRALRNTLSVGLLKLAFAFPAPILLALLLNELRSILYKRIVQTVIITPHFLSWVIYGAVLYIALSPATGFVNSVISSLGFEKIRFFQKPGLFQPILVISSILKSSGWSAIIYLAAISTIDPTLYDAASMDGANRWQKMRHVTLPGLSFTIVTLFILRIGYFLNVGFGQVFVLQNAIVLSTGDIIETFIYRVGLQGARFDFTAAAGLFNAAVGMIMLVLTDRLAKGMDLPGIL